MLKPFSRVMGVACMLAASLWGAPVTAQNVDPEGLALAKTYIEVSGPPVTIQLLGDVIGQNLIRFNPDLGDQIKAVIPPLLPRFEDYMTRMKEDVARVFASHFTVPELKEIIAFYQTPIGQKYAKEKTEAQIEADPISRRWGARIGEDMVDAIAKELAAKGIELKRPTPNQ